MVSVSTKRSGQAMARATRGNSTVKRLARRACELLCAGCDEQEIERCMRFLLETDLDCPTQIKEITLANGVKLAWEIFEYGHKDREFRIVVTEEIEAPD